MRAKTRTHTPPVVRASARDFLFRLAWPVCGSQHEKVITFVFHKLQNRVQSRFLLSVLRGTFGTEIFQDPGTVRLHAFQRTALSPNECTQLQAIPRTMVLIVVGLIDVVRAAQHRPSQRVQ